MPAPTQPDEQSQTPDLPDKIPALNPTTKQVVMIDSGDASTAAQAGWTLLDKQQALAAEQQEYVGSGAGALAAASAGYLRGLTGSTSDIALDSSGVAPGALLKQLAEQHAVASGAGHVAGVVGGIVAGEAGGEALGAAGSALGGVPGVAAKLGEAATDLVPGLSEAAEGGSVIAKAASGAIRGAVETPFYGVGDQITEDVFDNKPLVAEQLLSEAGKDALLGGATGGAFEGALGLAKRFAPDALVSAGKALDKLATKFKPEEVNSSDDIRAFSSALGDVDSKVEDQIAEFHKAAKSQMVEKLLGDQPVLDADRAAAGNLVNGLLDGFQKARVSGVVGDAMEQRISAVAKSIGDAESKADLFNAFDSLKKKTDPLLKFKAPLSPEQDLAIRPLRDAIGSVRKALEDEQLFGEAGKYQAQVNEALRPYYAAREGLLKGKTSLFDRIKTKVGEDGAVEAAGVNEVAPSAGKAAGLVSQEARNSPLADAKKAAFENYVSAAKNALDTLEQTTYQKLGREVSANQFAQNLDELGTAKAKAVASKLKELKKPGSVKGDFVAGWHHIPGMPGVLPHHSPVGMVMGAAGAVLKTGKDLLTGQKNEMIYKIARHAARASESLSRNVDAALSSAGGRASLAAVASLTSYGQHKRGESAPEAFERRVAEINKLRQNPEKRTEALAGATSTLQTHAPGVAAQVQQKMVARDEYLASKAPKDPLPAGSSLTQGKPYKPSDAEIRQFEKIHHAVINPVSIVDDLKGNRLTPAVVDAVKSTSPAMYQDIVEKVQANLAGRKGPLPPGKTVQLSILLGQPAGYGVQMSGRTQQMFAVNPTPEPEGKSGRPSVAGLSKLKVADRSSTKFDSAGSKD